MLVIVLNFSGCQTAPKPKPELTEAQQLEMSMYGPVTKSESSEKKEFSLKDYLIGIPTFLLYSFGAGKAQESHP